LFDHGSVSKDERRLYFQSLDSAKMVVTVLVDSLVPTGYIRFAPDGAFHCPPCVALILFVTLAYTGYFVFAAFASAFMLKVITELLITESCYDVLFPSPS
jgi:hypothetical protein